MAETGEAQICKPSGRGRALSSQVESPEGVAELHGINRCQGYP